MDRLEGFKNLVEEYFSDLELYVPVVAKVHGKDHPEFLEVKEVYDEMMRKIEDQGLEGVNETLLKNEFDKLREITKNFIVPEDTCETYEAVYQMLSALDTIYQV